MSRTERMSIEDLRRQQCWCLADGEMVAIVDPFCTNRRYGIFLTREGWTDQLICTRQVEPNPSAISSPLGVMPAVAPLFPPKEGNHA